MPITIDRMLKLIAAAHDCERKREQLVQSVETVLRDEPDHANALRTISGLLHRFHPSLASIQALESEKLYLKRYSRQIQKNTEAARLHRARKAQQRPIEQISDPAEQADAEMRQMMDRLEAEAAGESEGDAGPSIHDTLDWGGGLGLGRAGGTGRKSPPKDSE